MNIQPITLDPRIANIHYKDYRKKVQEHKKRRIADAEKQIQEGGKIFRAGRKQRSTIEREDEILMKSYRALARGQRILNLDSVIASAGLDDKNWLPKLAVARADWKTCQIRAELDSSRDIVGFMEKYEGFDWSRNRYRGNAVHITASKFKDASRLGWQARQNVGKQGISHFQAAVPSIPAHLRPEDDLSKYHILWEPVWELRQAPEDPLLLRHIAGNMYTVLAQWDLTPLEQAVLEGRIY